MQAACVPHKYW